jgi:hypothetical protein
MGYFKNKEVTLDYRRKKRRNQSHLQGIDRSTKEGESSYYQMGVKVEIGDYFVIPLTGSDSSIRHTKRSVYVGLFSVV